jgi:hypothetical protein
MKQLLISGASVSAGAGLPNGKQNPNLFLNRLAVECLQYPQHQVNNISLVGADNKQIFLDTAIELGTSKYSDALVCWQSMPRINYNFGLESYPTSAPIVGPVAMSYDINLLAGQQVSKKEIIKLQKYFLRYYNPHWELLELVKYINILKGIAQQHGTSLHFINYQMPWLTFDYFQPIDYNTPSDLDPFTQEVLQSEFRTDKEVYELYKLIHNCYNSVGGINKELWLNLNTPLTDIKTDSVSIEELHPGESSQNVFFNYLAPLLKK